MKSMFRVNRDPNLIPVGARVYIACSVLAMALICIGTKSGALGKLSACGIVLGIFGSGVLYWETIADEIYLQSVRNEISRSADSRCLSTSEVGAVAAMTGLGFVIAAMLLVLVVLKFEGNHDVARFLVGTALTVAVFLVPALIVYAVQKGFRIWGINWLTGLELTPEAHREAYIRRFLRLLGFAALFMSGVIQLPAALF